MKKITRVKKHIKDDIKTFKHEISDDKKLLKEIKKKPMKKKGRC